MQDYAIYVKCDHVSPADVKMSRANEIEIVDTEGSDDPMGFIHICNSCKAVLGANFNEVVVM